MIAAKQDILKRLNDVEGCIDDIRTMGEDGQSCVGIPRRTLAVRAARGASEKLGAPLVERHVRGYVQEGIKAGRETKVIGELVQLCN